MCVNVSQPTIMEEERNEGREEEREEFKVILKVLNIQELRETILSYLDVSSLKNVALVSK